MGIYVNSVAEIEQAIEDMLDGLEGEVYKDDFIKASQNIASSYEHFTK